MGRRVQPPVEGHVVMEFMVGNTHCKICDDYCRDKTPEQVDAILKRIGEISYRAQYQQYLAEAEAAKKAAEDVG